MSHKRKREASKPARTGLQSQAVPSTRSGLLARVLIPEYRAWILSGGRPNFFKLIFGLDSLSVYIILTLGLANLIFDPDLSRIPERARSIIGIGIGACGYTRIMYAILISLRFKKLGSTPWLVDGAMLAWFFCDLLSATLMVAAGLYYFGAVAALSVLLQTHWPYLSAKVSEWVSAAVNWAISGIVGGVAFEQTRRLFRHYFVKEVQVERRQVRHRPQRIYGRRGRG